MTTIPAPTRLQQLLRALRTGERAPRATRTTSGLIALATTAEARSARKAKAAMVSTRTPVPPAPKNATVRVRFPWGTADLVQPSASRVYRPTGINTWAIVVTPKGEMHEVSETNQTGQRVAANQVETLASLIDAGGLVWDAKVVFT